MKKKYKFSLRFEYEESDFLKAIKEGDWILLDGIENASSSIIENVTLLCGEKPELNLYESAQLPIKPKEGFHLFMTYNLERNHNMPISNILLDKCLIYHLDSFINKEKIISQIIYGFLINSNFSTDTELIKDISSRISHLHQKIVNELDIESEKISERTIINFCKNWKFQVEEKEDIIKFAKSIKNNFLYFYFPSSDLDKFVKIINDNIKEKGINFISLAKKYATECKEQLDLLSILVQDIEKKKNYDFSLGDIIDCCLNFPFNYLDNLRKTISEIINKVSDNNNKNNFLPLKIFERYLEEIFNLYKNRKEYKNKDIIKDTIDFPRVKMLLLIVELSRNKLLS